MLQLQTKTFDLCRVSKLIVKHNIKARISNQRITLEGEISDELLGELYNCITICNIQNFVGEVFSITQQKSNILELDENLASFINGEERDLKKVLAPESKYEYEFSIVKRGEVYLCDFGDPYGSEQGYKGCAIVVQNDDRNLCSPTTIVLPCTTKQKKRLPVHLVFSYENMSDYDDRIGTDKYVVMAEQIRTVDKRRLRKFLGTMTPEFMERIQEIIDISLSLQRNIRPKEHRELNVVKMKLLSFVDVNDLLMIVQARDSDNVKVEKILRLFGFDMKTNGVDHLFKAILISTKETYFNLETLCNSVAKSELDVGRDEIKRLIVARVKEVFKFKNSPTIEFIRLVNSFLIKKEDEQYENNI